jgi:photosystem II stability/assembly factor-like uncharacterized protein/tetratricopeptide (TPR) repeat protein
MEEPTLMRRTQSATWILCVYLLVQAGPAFAAKIEPGVLRSLREDATLRDVHFVGDQHGWAVGDRGTIWHTADSGRSWQIQESNVTCTLNSVWFVSPTHGWAGGAEYSPYTPGSTGVLLQTRDGGQTWQRDPSLMLPGLRSIKFFNAQQGWAWGESSSLFPAGLCVTDDGGRTWTPVNTGSVQDWSTGDFIDPHTGAAAGSLGRLAVVRRRRVEPSRTPDVGLRNVRRLKLTAPESGWLVGDGGLVMHTADLGRTWQLPSGDTRGVLHDELDLRAVEVQGANIWAAGSPGSRVAVSNDNGATWQSFRTGQQLPIEDLVFVDAQRGWAVGAMGMILHTADGGHTWRRQRNFGTRVAILGLFSDPAAAPLEMFARLSGNDGYLSTVEIINRRDIDAGSLSFAAQNDRAAAALSAVGGGPVDTSWRFPLRQPGVHRNPAQWLAGWDRVNDGQAMSRLEMHLVRQIRQWRPEIIVTHAASLRGDDPLGHTINQLVLRAVEQAGDATRYPEQSAQLGLEPWRVRKVFGAIPDGKLGTVNVTTSQLAPRLGASLAEAAQTPRGWLETTYRPSPAAIGFQSLIDTLPQGVGQADFFSGLNLSPGGEARRLLADVPDASADLMRRQAQKQRNLQAILTQSERTNLDSGRYLAELAQLTMGLDSRMAGDVLYQLGQHYAQRGEWESAAEAMQLIASRHADHDLARPALTWLVQNYASSEVAWQVKRRSIALRGATVESARPEQAVQLARQIEHQHSLWFTEPRVQFPYAVALQQRGAPREADKAYQNLARSRPDDAWRNSALGESWLLDTTKGSSPKPMTIVTRSATKPRLDGKLDDQIWSNTRPLELRSTTDDDSTWPAVALLACDDEFLYLAVSCRRTQPASAIDRKQVRPRDPDLSGQDRVELLLDIDRDYGTYYRLAIDERGWACDQCWTDVSWNPQWFIASGGDERSWTAEAAIPWSELIEKPPVSRAAWGMQVHRIAPDTGFQSWTTPASTAVIPEAFGYAIFE